VEVPFHSLLEIHQDEDGVFLITRDVFKKVKKRRKHVIEESTGVIDGSLCLEGRTVSEVPNPVLPSDRQYVFENNFRAFFSDIREAKFFSSSSRTRTPGPSQLTTPSPE
jgi:hypothetical protein